MRLLELVAPAAAGKSVLAAALLRTRPRSGWVDARRLVRPSRVPGGRPLTDVLPWRLTAGALGDILLGAPSEDATTRALLAVATDWDEFLALIAGASPDAGADGPSADDLRTRVLERVARRWFEDALARQALIVRAVADAAGDTTALLDEGLLHPYKLEAGAGPDPERRRRYRDTVPLPDVVVRPLVPVATIAERLERRAAHRPDALRLTLLAERGRAAFVDEAERTTQEVELMVSRARERGAVVIEVEGLAPLEQQVRAVRGAVDGTRR